MTPKQFLLRMHERAPWKSRNVYNRDLIIPCTAWLAAFADLPVLGFNHLQAHNSNRPLSKMEVYILIIRTNLLKLCATITLGWIKPDFKWGAPVIQFAQIELVFFANIHICIENFKYIRRSSGLKKNPAQEWRWPTTIYVKEITKN
jgi:hypothetical protein